MTPEHERYLWLREGKSHYGGYCGSAPFVMLPNKSRLYAIAVARSEVLDTEIDLDILNTKIQRLYEQNEITERGLNPCKFDRYSQEYSDILFELARTELKWSNERVNKLKEFLNDTH